MRTTPIQLPRFTALAAVMAAAALAANAAPATADETCGDYGTTVTFLESPAEAAKQALKEEKLVFVLHVSGNFEVSEYT